MSVASSQTRRALLESAISLFSKKGYNSVGIREIADAADANIASIKYHFGSKRDLYLAAVSEVMGQHDGENPWRLLEDLPEAPLDAAGRLVQFIRLFLRHLIPPGSSVESCSSLMIREALTPSEALDTIVDDFLTPNNELLIAALGKLVPDADRRFLEHLAGSVLAQVLHIRVFRPFVERLRGVNLSDGATLDEMAMEIAEFSLRGLGLNEVFIIEALQAARDGRFESLEGVSS